MAITLESAQRLTALKNKVDGVTNIESETLAEAIDNALAGYGQGGGSTTNEDEIITRNLIEYQNDRVTSIGATALNSCSSLTSVNFPLVNSIGNNAFATCRKLTSVNFPLATSIGNSVFMTCSSLTSVNFPLVNSIGSYAFSGCSSLTSVNFPLVNSIGIYAFNGCSNLKSLILRNESICNLSNANAFNGTPIASGTGYIYIPSALVDTYKSASNWSTYANQFRALEDYTVDGTTTGELDESKVNGGTA